MKASTQTSTIRSAANSKDAWTKSSALPQTEADALEHSWPKNKMSTQRIMTWHGR